MSSATEASKKRWNSISCFGPRGTSRANPLTVSVAAAAPFGSSLADHQGPLRSSRVNVERGDLVFQASSPARFSIWISSMAWPSWDKSACRPGRTNDFARSACFRNPAPQDAIALGVELRFLSVVGAVIEDAAPLGMEHEFLGIELAGFPNHLTRGRIEKNVPLSQREKIRALPHLAGVHGIAGILSRPLSGCERVQILPLAQVLRAVEKHTAALLEEARAGPEVPIFTFAPKKRIAESRQTRVLWRLKHGLIPFGPGKKLWIGGSSKALYLAKVVDTVTESRLFRSDSLHTRVQNCSGAVIVHRASGETPIGVVPAGIRSKGNWQMAPVNHVLAHRVSPVHVAPDRGVWVVLEKHVVAALPIDRAVGIIHPVFGGEQMILRAERIRGETLPRIRGLTLPERRRFIFNGTATTESPHEIRSEEHTSELQSQSN